MDKLVLPGIYNQSCVDLGLMICVLIVLSSINPIVLFDAPVTAQIIPFIICSCLWCICSRPDLATRLLCLLPSHDDLKGGGIMGKSCRGRRLWLPVLLLQVTVDHMAVWITISIFKPHQLHHRSHDTCQPITTSQLCAVIPT